MFLYTCTSYPNEVPVVVTRDPDAQYSLVILHTNDHHGSVLPRVEMGGLAQRASFFNQVRAENSGNDILILDAGDINTGSAVSNMFSAKPDIFAYNAMGYEAVTFGNHEFDGSLEKLKGQMELSDFSWLGANIKLSREYLGKPYIIKDYKGYRVGIFGLTTLRTLEIARPDKSLSFLNEIECAKSAVEILREKESWDIVILLSHLGDVKESEKHVTSLEIANSVDGIDLIIDGHSHSYFEKPIMVNGVPIVSAYEYGKCVGLAELKIKNGKIINFDWKLEKITDEKYEEDKKISSLLSLYVNQAESSLNDVVLKSSDEFEFADKLTRYKETSSGDFLTDGMVWYLKSIGVNVDFAITNGGGIRSGLSKGDITKKDIMTMLPFENYLVVVDLRGSDLIKLFDFVGSVYRGQGAFAQVSTGVNYTLSYDKNGKGCIYDLLIDGDNIDENRIYHVATNDYLASGGDGYEMFTKCVSYYNSSMLLSDVFIDYAKAHKDVVKPCTYGRIKVVDSSDLQQVDK